MYWFFGFSRYVYFWKKARCAWMEKEKACRSKILFRVGVRLPTSSPPSIRPRSCSLPSSWGTPPFWAFLRDAGSCPPWRGVDPSFLHAVSATSARGSLPAANWGWPQGLPHLSGQGGQVCDLHSPPSATAHGVGYRYGWLWWRRGAVRFSSRLQQGWPFLPASCSGQNRPKGGRGSQCPLYPGCPAQHNQSQAQLVKQAGWCRNHFKLSDQAYNCTANCSWQGN